MNKKVHRRTVDLSAYPDLVVIYRGVDAFGTAPGVVEAIPARFGRDRILA
jgi:hypothetical protein